MIWALTGLGMGLIWYVLYLLWNVWGWERLASPMPVEDDALPSATVLVPARNEAANLEACLKALLSQNYPPDRLNIICIDDHSEDDTFGIASRLAAQHPRLSVLRLDGEIENSYKKAALAAGIAASESELIFTTDADCWMGPDWARTMASAFQPETGLVSGPVMLQPDPGAFQDMQALEFMGLILVGGGSIAHRRPNLANGANLAFRRKAFEEVEGYRGIDHIASGDDELLMHKIAAAGYGIGFAKAKESIVSTPAQPDLKSFAAQRIRWVSKSGAYKNGFITLQLAVSWLSMWYFPLALVWSFLDPNGWMWLLGGYVLKMGGEGITLFRAAVFFDNLRLLRWLPLEEVFHVPYLIWAGIAGNLGTYTWKGRKVR